MNGNRIRLSVVASTNLYTTQLLGQCVIDEFTLVSAQFQEQGKGQRGKSWQSNAGENMLSSLVFLPKIKVKNQFLVSAATALSLIELLQNYGLIAQIKWPNDILVKGKKIAGILIENQIKGEKIESSVIGVGLNVNQSLFDAFDWEATSISIETKSAIN
ncbi:MAG: biotin--[acetyl-CoA-carboxylase] ligase, partial [Salibacteraceae bacterium]|nr:biotin--[acetyl-CoA-carboxylase] ligase [Salibacteraceae bacterium]